MTITSTQTNDTIPAAADLTATIDQPTVSLLASRMPTDSHHRLAVTSKAVDRHIMWLRLRKAAQQS